MRKGEYMTEELEKWRYPRFFSDTIDEDGKTIYSWILSFRKQLNSVR